MKSTLYLFVLLFTWIPFCGDAQENEHFGESKKIFQQQIINPKASDNHDPITGMRGEDAKIVYDKYVNSFNDSKGESESSSNFGIGKNSIGQNKKDTKGNFEEETKKRLAQQHKDAEQARESSKQPIIPVKDGAIDPNPGGGYIPKDKDVYIIPGKGAVPDTGAPIYP